MPNPYCSEIDQDPEELLYNLGFGTDVSSPVDRIPSRFLHPSQVDGNDLDNFIVQQEEQWETSSMHLNGYHGLAGYPTNGEQVHGIVGKIHEKIRERNRELKRCQRPSFLNAAFSVMAARAFRNLVRPTPPVASAPTSILEPLNRDFLERQESLVTRRRRRRPRLVLGKNSFVLDTDEELVDELDAVDSDVGDGLAGETRSIHGGSGSALEKGDNHNGSFNDGTVRDDAGGSVHVDSIRKNEDCGSINDVSKGGGLVMGDAVSISVDWDTSNEKLDPDFKKIETLIGNEQIINNNKGNPIREKCPVTENGLGVVNEKRRIVTKTISKKILSKCRDIKSELVETGLVSTINEDAHHTVKNVKNELRPVDTKAMGQLSNTSGVFKPNEEQLSVQTSASGHCDGSVKLGGEIGSVKQWLRSDRSDSQSQLGRVESKRMSGRSTSGLIQYGLGWVRNSNGDGWVPQNTIQPTQTGERRNSLPTSLCELYGGVTPLLDRSAPSVEALRSHLRRQSGVDELSVELNERLEECSIETLSNEAYKASDQKLDIVTELESLRNPNCTLYKPVYKNGSDRPPLLSSRAESGFESCDIELRDEMDALDRCQTETATVSAVQDDASASKCERVECADPQHVIKFQSPSNNDDKLSSQPVDRTSLHREFLEKIRHRCRITTDTAAVLPTPTDKIGLKSDRVVAPPNGRESLVEPAVCGSLDSSSECASSQTSATQDRNRLEEFHEGCVSAVDRMQKSMQLYVRRLRTMEQTWGDTYNKWFLSNRKSEKGDLNQLASVHKSILEEASQTQALLRDHSDAIDRAKREISCRTVDSQLVMCSSQLRTVAHDLDGIIREQDSMLRQMRRMEFDDEDCESLSSTITLASGESVNESTNTNSTSIPPSVTAPPSEIPETASSLITPSTLQSTNELAVASSPLVAPISQSSVPEVTPQIPSAVVQSSPSTDGIHKLLTKLKHEMTADIKSTIGEDCVRFEKDLKSTSQQMEDVKSFLSRMLSVIQTNK